jgi:hypothetical protein
MEHEWSWWYLLDWDFWVAVFEVLSEKNSDWWIELGNIFLSMFGALASAMVPIVFIVGIVFFITRNAIQGRRLVDRLTHEFPEIRNPENHIEATIRGIQKATRAR